MNSLFPRPILDGGLCALWLWWYLLPLFVCQCRLLFAVTSVVFALFAGLLAARRDYAWNSMHFFAVSSPPASHDLRATEGNSAEKAFSFFAKGANRRPTRSTWSDCVCNHYKRRPRPGKRISFDWSVHSSGNLLRAPPTTHPINWVR